MKQQTLLLCIFITIGLCCSQSLPTTEQYKMCPEKPLTWEQKLKNHLMLCGSKNHALRKQSKVKLSIYLLNFKHESTMQMFFIFTQTMIQWTDEQLKWDPNDFNGISNVLVHSSEMWTPSINNNGYDMPPIYSTCRIFSLGIVICVPEMIYYAYCIADVRVWPRDAQNCSLQLGVWDGDDERSKKRLELEGCGISQMYPSNPREWNLTDYKLKVNQSAERQLDLFFSFKRSAATLEVTVIHLSVLLSVLTMVPLVLDPRRDLRVCLATFSLMCHLYFLPDLASEMPQHSNSPPLILFYFRGSIFISIMNIAFSIAAKALCARGDPVPEILITKVYYIFKSYGKFVSFLRWRMESIAGSKNKDDWTDFVNVLNSVLVCGSVAAYATLFRVFVSSEAP